MAYIHKVHYYETDKMGITHHSNYIRWMEEARIDFLSHIGWDYSKIESMGIISPVISVSGEFKKTTTFDEIIEITVKVTEFKGVKLKLHYEMKNARDEIVFTGTSSHAFLDTKGVPIRMKQAFPEFFSCLCSLVEEKPE